MGTQSTTLSSVGTATLVLNPLAKSTTVILTALTAGSSLTSVQIDFSLDDPTALGAATTSWGLLSSGATMLTSTILATPLSYTVLSPISMVRLNSTLMVASSGTFALKALQSVTA